MNISDHEDYEEKHLNRRETLHYLYDSAIEAEKKSGFIKEDTSEKARRSLLVRMLTIILGFIVVVLGLLMLILPGPGLLVTAIGLAILSKDIPFARRLREIVMSKLPQDESGQLTKSTIASMIFVATLGIVLSAISIWWTFFR